jgi:hypothetical protein
VGGGPNSDEGTDTVVLQVYMYFVRRIIEAFVILTQLSHCFDEIHT